MPLHATARTHVKRFIERVGGVHVLRDLPGGVDIGCDLRRWLPNLEIDVVFDVGANRGQSARAFAAAFPRARIHSFEPSTDWFSDLKHAVAPLGERVRCHALALGAEEGRHAFGVSELVTDADAGDVAHDTVTVTTLDAFCDAHAIPHVGYLKIDTEGHDLDVLRSASALLRSARIDLVQVEAGMNPRNARHVPFAAFERFLGEHGYLLFGFYDQQHEWSGEPQLRRADAVFVSPEVWGRER